MTYDPLEKQKSTRAVKIQAKRDIQIARADSRTYNEHHALRWGLVAAAVAVMSIGGCSTAVWGFGSGHEENIENAKIAQSCIAKGMEWTRADECRKADK